MPQSVPLMGMGLIGFSPHQLDHLSNLLKTRVQTLLWEPRPFLEADALWVNGERAMRLDNGLVRVPSQVPTTRAIQLNLEEMDRPLGFAMPVAPGIDLPHVFDPHSSASVAGIFEHFEDRLHALTAQLALGGVVADMEGSPASPVYHLLLHGKLVAIVNLRGNVGLAPGISAADVEQADWHGMPPSAGDIPEAFSRSSIAEVMWQFAARTTRDVLPERYRKKPIHFRHAPTVRQTMVKDTHLVLLRELSGKPQRFAELQQNTGLGEAQLASALAALYFVGAITSDARRANPAAGQPARPAKEARWNASIAPSTLGHGWSLPPPPDSDDETAPASLRPGSAK